MARTFKYKTLKKLTEGIEEYFESVTYEVDGIKRVRPTVSGLALSLGITTRTLINYGKSDRFGSTVSEAKQRIEVALETRLYGTSPTGVIFNLKNNYGWKDKQEIDQNTQITVVELKTDFRDEVKTTA